MISVTDYPKRIVNEDNAQVSKWSCAHQPIVFKMLRSDISVSSVSDNGAGKCRLNTLNNVSESVVGQTMYINCGIYTGNYPILAFSNTGSKYIDINLTFSSSQLNGYANFITARPSYYIETQIYGVSDTNQYYLLGSSVNKPDYSGVAKVSVQRWVKALCSYVDTFSYDVINKKDRTLGGRFNIKYRENWTGHEGTYSAMSSTLIYYYTNSAKQIGEKYGSNMGDYVPFNNANDEPKAKFASDFKKPTYFPGFPFSMTFIYSDTVSGHQLKRNEKKKDVNGSEISTTQTNLNINESQFVNRLMIAENYAPTVKEIDLWLTAETGSICIGYVDEDYIAAGYAVLQCGLIDIEAEASDGG